MAQGNYSKNGISVSKTSIAVGDELTITYKGELAKSGAKSVWAHLGYGDNWESTSDVSMKKAKNGTFEAKIKVAKHGNLHLCFKDGWGNWDNNNYSNYSFKVATKATTATKTTTPTTKTTAKPQATKTATRTPSVSKTSSPVKKATDAMKASSITKKAAAKRITSKK